MLSVIIPAYNAENTVIDALESVRLQTSRERFEIIVIDDGSTDQTARLLKEYMAKHPALSIALIQQENKGVSVARNAGMRRANGDYIALLDADDVWLPEKIEKQMAVFKNFAERIDFLATSNNGEKLGLPYKNRDGLLKISLHKLLIKVGGQTSTAVFRKEVLRNTGFFDENQRFSEDANYWMRIAKHNKMYILPESLVICGGGKRSFGEAGLSANIGEMERGIQKNIMEMHAAGRITKAEYILFFLFSKLKYIRRKFRVMYDF